MPRTNGYILLSGSANTELSVKVAKKLKTKVYYPCTKFADGEINVQIPVSVRRKDVFIIQPTCGEVNANIMEILLIADAARRASANEIILICPYFGYSRQDRKCDPRVPVSASLIASMLEHSGVSRIITLDIHSEQQQGFFKGPWDNLYASYILVPYIKKLKIKNLVVVSPDKGGAVRATAYARRLDAEGLAIVYKERDTSVKNSSKALDMIGDVQNKNVVIVDDIIDTAGSITNAEKLLYSRGAKDVCVVATHGIFSPPAAERLSKSSLTRVVVTDSIPLNNDIKSLPNVKVISIAGLLAKAILATHTGISFSGEIID